MAKGGDFIRQHNIARATATCVLLCLLAACSSGGPLPVEPTPVPEDALDPALLLEDIDYLLMMLKLNYPFYHAQNSSFSSTLKETRERIQNQKVTMADFSKEIDALLACFIVRAHLDTVSPSAYQSYRAAFFASESEHGEYALWTALFDAPSVRAYYALPNITDGAQAPVVPEVSTQILADGRIALAVIPSFAASRVRTEGEALRAFFTSAKNFSHIILDLRGNEGGSTQYWVDNILLPLQRGPLLYDVTFLMKDGMVNRYFTAGDQLLPAKREWLDASGARAANILVEYGVQPELAKDFSFLVQSRYRLDPPAQPSGFRGKIYVLCDEKNVSAAEAFIAMCKLTGFAKLVGSVTGGDGLGSGDPMFLALPNSGLLVRYTAAYALNPDGTCNQVRGTLPDVQIAQGEDALTVCLDVIEGKR